MDIVEFAERICEENGLTLYEHQKIILRKLKDMPPGTRPYMLMTKCGPIVYFIDKEKEKK